MAVVWIVWDTPVVYPLQVLVVFFHEMSHGLAAIATGGSIEEISVAAEQGGYCVTRGGNIFLTLSAGYLGSLAWGGAILVLGTRTRKDRVIAFLLGALLVVVSALLVRPLLGFGFLFGLGAGAAMMAGGIYLKEWINDTLLKVIGLSSCLYALLDLKSDILDRPGLRSDAYLLAQHTGIPTVVWGFLWIAIALAGALFFILLACRNRPPASGPGRGLESGGGDAPKRLQRMSRR